jgi:hypothetical protein
LVASLGHASEGRENVAMEAIERKDIENDIIVRKEYFFEKYFYFKVYS